MRRVVTSPKAALALAGALAVVAAMALIAADALPRSDEPPGGGTLAPGPSAPRGDQPGGGRTDANPELNRARQRGRSASEQPRRGPAAERIRWRDSVAVGLPHAGRLVRGVRLPAEGRTFFTWDPIHKRKPNRDWRRWGTDELVRTVLRVVRDFARENPGAPRIGIGDLSRPRGGDFGPAISGGIGHATHQNGLDVDIYYPLRSAKERAPLTVSEVDMRLAQDLVDRFVGAGAVKVFVGPSTPLTGPPDVVQAVVHHDNHLHARIAP
jgi:hypothetical protein